MVSAILIYSKLQNKWGEMLFVQMESLKKPLMGNGCGVVGLPFIVFLLFPFPLVKKVQNKYFLFKQII